MLPAERSHRMVLTLAAIRSGTPFPHPVDARCTTLLQMLPSTVHQTQRSVILRSVRPILLRPSQEREAPVVHTPPRQPGSPSIRQPVLLRPVPAHPVLTQ